jgi:hypothetical protein
MSEQDTPLQHSRAVASPMAHHCCPLTKSTPSPIYYRHWHKAFSAQTKQAAALRCVLTSTCPPPVVTVLTVEDSPMSQSVSCCLFIMEGMYLGWCERSASMMMMKSPVADCGAGVSHATGRQRACVHAGQVP